MSTERRLKGLKVRQKSLLSSFELIKTFVDKYNETDDEKEVPVRLERLTTLWVDLTKVQGEIEELDEAGIDEQLKQRIAFETAYYQVKGFLLSKNKSICESSSEFNPQLATQFPPSTSQVRLPDVKIPVFDGALQNWLNFHDLFVSLVHSSHDFSNIQKFYYLRLSLAGEALTLVQSVPLCAQNYLVAWNLLIEYYQDPVRLKQMYVSALFEFPPLKKESADELHSLAEQFETNVKVLKQLGERTEFWDILLIRMLSSCLDPKTRRDWVEFASNQPNVAFSDLCSFIQRRVSVLQAIQFKLPDAPPPSSSRRTPS